MTVSTLLRPLRGRTGADATAPTHHHAHSHGHAAEHAAPRPAANSTVLLVTVLVAQLMIVLDANVVTVALSRIQSALGFSPTSLTWVMNAYTLALGGLLLLGARMGALFGRRATFLGGLAVFTLASALGGLATTPAMLIGARVLQGLGAAVAAPSILALITSEFPQGRARLRAMGWFSAASISGAAVGLVVGGALVQWLSWRWVMFVNVPVGIALIVVARVVIRESERRRGSFDLSGAVISTLGMTSLVYGFVRAPSAGWLDPITVIALSVGVLAGAAFVAREKRAAVPMLPLAVFAHRTRSAAYLARTLLVGGVFANFYFLSLLFQHGLKYGPMHTGLAFLPITVVIFFAAQLSSRVLTERFSSKAVVTVGMLFTAASLLMLSRVDLHTPYSYFFLTFVVMGLGNGIAFGPLTSLGLTDVSGDLVGTASGLVNVSQQVGATLGLAVLTSAYGVFAKHPTAAHPSALTAGSHGALLVGFVLLLLAVVTALVGLPRERREQPETVDEVDEVDEVDRVEAGATAGPADVAEVTDAFMVESTEDEVWSERLAGELAERA